jgi:hypothetical protein
MAGILGMLDITAKRKVYMAAAPVAMFLGNREVYDDS